MIVRGAAVEGATRSRWSSPARRSRPPDRPGPCLSTNASLTTIAAPDPSEVGEHCSLVSGSEIIREARMSSRRVLLLELGVRVVHRVLVVLVADLREMLCGGAVFASCARGRHAEHPRRHGKANSSISASALTCLPSGDSRSSAPPPAASRAASSRSPARSRSRPGRLEWTAPAEVQRRRTRRTVVVDVDDRDAGHVRARRARAVRTSSQPST